MARILHVAHLLPPEGNTGVENYTLALARAQARAGSDVAVFARGLQAPHNKTPSLEMSPTDKQFGLERTVIDDGVLRVLSRFTSPHQFGHRRRRIEMTDCFRAFVKEWRPDVVHFQHLLYHSMDYPAAARAAGAATVLTLHDLWFTCPVVQRVDFRGALCGIPPGRICLACTWKGRKASLVPPQALVSIERGPARHLLDFVPTIDDVGDWTSESQRCLDGVDVVLSPSRFVMENLLEHGVRHPRLEFCPYGIEPPGVPPRPSELRDPSQAVRFGVIGTHALKGVPVAIEAFRQLENHGVKAELLWYGGGTALGSDAAPLPPNVVAKGAFGAAEIESVYASFDCLIVPSVWWENAPFVIREAFARGLPVIASNLGGMAESVRDGVDGLLFPVSDAAALAECVRRFATEPDLRQSLRDGIQMPCLYADHLRQLDEVYARARQFPFDARTAE